MICARVALSAIGADTLRAAYLDDHKAFLRSGALTVLQSGPLFDASGAQTGALVVAEVKDVETMRMICERDPFVAHRIYDRVDYLEWRITLGRSF